MLKVVLSRLQLDHKRRVVVVPARPAVGHIAFRSSMRTGVGYRSPSRSSRIGVVLSTTSCSC